MPSTLSRAEFAELVASAVEAVGIESANGRVHVVPGERMLRYYTTQGVMDRPELAVTANGKEARYGHRHLLQFVAAKRLQAGGASLPDIRDRLAHVTLSELDRLAAIPAGVIPPDLADVDVPTPPADRPPFWRHRPDRDGSAAVLDAGAAPDDQQLSAPSVPLSPSFTPVPNKTVTVVTLGPGIEVHIDTAVHSPTQVELLAAALANALPTLPASREEP